MVCFGRASVYRDYDYLRAYGIQADFLNRVDNNEAIFHLPLSRKSASRL